MATDTLGEWRILIVEDDPIIALDLSAVLTEAGANVVGPAYTVKQALAFVAEQALDAAVLDYRLEHETTLPIAAELEFRRIPFLFCTSSRGDPERAYPHVRILDKPVRAAQLVAEIKALAPPR